MVPGTASPEGLLRLTLPHRGVFRVRRGYFGLPVGVPHYDLHRLGWHEFQELCHTVAREVLGQTIERFLDGRDGGRDGAFVGEWTTRDAEPWTGRFVFQCKHTSGVGRNLRLSDIADEIQKAQRLVETGLCDVYILMTNLGVSGKTEEEVDAALRAIGVGQVAVFGSS